MSATPTDLGEAPPAPVRTGAVVPVLASAGITVALMQTLVIPLVPELPRLLNASAAGTAWAITATLLAAAVATPIMGRLGDMYGKRRMLLISIGMLIAGSVVAALSSSLVPMIAGRALQGLAAGVIPLGISIMRDELPTEKLGTATALMSASLGVGGALGLPTAALLAENFNWHTLFWLSAALGAIVFVLVVRFVPESAVRSGGRFDVLGAARAVDRPDFVAAGNLSGRRLGLDRRPDARPVRARGGRVAHVGLVGASYQRAARRPAHDRPPAGAADQPGVDGVRLRDVRDVAGTAAVAADAQGNWFRARPVDARVRSGDGPVGSGHAGRRTVLGEDLEDPRPEGDADARRARGRGRVRRGQSC